jgi:type I restriction enzyme M protein
MLCGKYHPHEYDQMILPFTVLRRIDCVLEPTKKAILKEATKRDFSATSVNPSLTRTSGATFYNTSPMDLKAIVGDQDNVAIDLPAYRQGLSPHVKGKASARSDQTESSLQSS